jgi:hypothetical protein
MEGQLDDIDLEPEVSAAASILSDNDTNSTKELDSEYC